MPTLEAANESFIKYMTMMRGLDMKFVNTTFELMVHRMIEDEPEISHLSIDNISGHQQYLLASVLMPANISTEELFPAGVDNGLIGQYECEKVEDFVEELIHQFDSVVDAYYHAELEKGRQEAAEWQEILDREAYQTRAMFPSSIRGY